MNSDNISKELERFVYDNPEMERLEAILDDFNPFVALGWTKQEIRHSACLRWLLDPSETHGLGSYFLRSFLKRVARSSTIGPTIIDVDSWEYSNLVVLKEWNGIDILVRDDKNGFLAVVENKIASQEHSQQLQRYRDLVEKQFPSHKKLFAYLTVDGVVPSDEEYSVISYADIVELIRDTLNRRGEQLSSDVQSFLAQYLEMLRRHIVEDSEVQELCRRIYEKHKRALDVLFEHRPDRVSEVSEFLRDLVANDPDLVLDHCSKALVRFIPRELDVLPKLGEGWTRSGRLILFELDLGKELVHLKVILGPGNEEARNKIHQMIVGHSDLLNRATQRLYPKWWTFHAERWVSTREFADTDLEDLKDRIKQRFERFRKKTVPEALKALQDLRTLPLPSGQAGEQR